MRFLHLLITLLFSLACAVGPTPERVGFNYPEAGIRFSPRRHVVSDTVRGNIASTENPPYSLVCPRASSQIENPNTRLLMTCIRGNYSNNLRPIFDEVSDLNYGIDILYEFELIEEREIELPWSGLESGIGTLRIHRMTPIAGGDNRYAFSILVAHFGNTFEFSWRDHVSAPPDEKKEEKFFYWTHGLRFYEPDVEE